MIDAAGTHLVEDLSASDADKAKAFTVTVNKDGENGELSAGQLKQYAGTYKLTIGGSKVDAQSQVVYDNTSRAKIGADLATAKTTATNKLELTLTISSETGYIQIGSGTAAVNPAAVTLYCGLDGGATTGASFTPDSDDFSVTVAAWISEQSL